MSKRSRELEGELYSRFHNQPSDHIGLKAREELFNLDVEINRLTREVARLRSLVGADPEIAKYEAVFDAARGMFCQWDDMDRRKAVLNAVYAIEGHKAVGS